MVRISKIVEKWRSSREEHVKNQKEEEIIDKLTRMQEKVDELIKDGRLLDAGVIASHMLIIAENEGVYPVAVKWMKVKRLAKVFESAKQGLL